MTIDAYLQGPSQQHLDWCLAESLELWPGQSETSRHGFCDGTWLAEPTAPPSVTSPPSHPLAWARDTTCGDVDCSGLRKQPAIRVTPVGSPGEVVAPDLSLAPHHLRGLPSPCLPPPSWVGRRQQTGLILDSNPRQKFAEARFNLACNVCTFKGLLWDLSKQGMGKGPWACRLGVFRPSRTQVPGGCIGATVPSAQSSAVRPGVRGDLHTSQAKAAYLKAGRRPATF